MSDLSSGLCAKHKAETAGADSECWACADEANADARDARRAESDRRRRIDATARAIFAGGFSTVADDTVLVADAEFSYRVAAELEAARERFLAGEGKQS